jgi:hypothetical protein
MAASVAVALFLATSALGEEVNNPTTPTTTSTSWSSISAQTVGEGKNVISVQAGYPGIMATYLHGMNNTFDLGGKFGFFYGAENGLGVAPGLRAQAVLRWLLSEQGIVKLGIEFEPGIYTYFSPFFGVFGGAIFGIVTPVKFTAAFQVLQNLSLHAGADLPLFINFVPGFAMNIPILIGGGAEYFITENLSLTLRLRFGPSFNINWFFPVTFGFDTLLGVAFKL